MRHPMHLVLLLPALLLGAAPVPAPGAEPGPPALAAPSMRVLMQIDEALRLAFPDCEVERTTVYLTEEQSRRASELSGRKLPGAIVYPYVATRDGVHVGTAYVDTHRVRTMRESVMIVVAPDQRVRRIEVLAFAEPEDYLASGRWYAQFVGKRLDDELNLKRGIRGITGATLTAKATTDSVRRVLAVHQVLNGEPAPTPEN